tara:strand:- start:793 stop:1113 length:321 start_codon:yes stop_codon:yes gene_type:complete
MNIQQMMKQAQKMQKKMEAMQEEMAHKEYVGTAGGDMVSITINGKHDIIKVSIDPSACSPDDTEILEDLVLAAFMQAKKRAEEDTSGAMSDMMGGMGLPPGFKMPF